MTDQEILRSVIDALREPGFERTGKFDRKVSTGTAGDDELIAWVHKTS